MVRYTADEFLNEYTKFLTKSNTSKKGSVELTFKRYDATDESNLPPTADKTGETRSKAPKKATKAGQKGAANPESSKKKGKGAPDNTKKTAAAAKEAPIKDPAVLIRARFGEKKVSCVVKATDVGNFNEQFRIIFRLYNKALVPAGQDSERMKTRKAAQQGKKK